MEYFNIGADEVFNLGSCPKCKLFCYETSPKTLYSFFLRKILKNLKKKYDLPIESNRKKKLKFIAWDDMFRGWTSAELD